MKKRKSQTVKMLVLLVIMCALYVGYIKLQPHLIAYQSRQALKNGCYVMLRTIGRGAKLSDVGEDAWIKPFTLSANRLGIIIEDPDQYNFEVSDEGEERVCRAQLAFRIQSHWLTLEDAFPEQFPPFETTHLVSFEHRVQKNF